MIGPPEAGGVGSTEPRDDGPGGPIDPSQDTGPHDAGRLDAGPPGASAGLVLARGPGGGSRSGVLDGDPPPELALALVDAGPCAELARERRPDPSEPALLYLATLNTPRSRSTGLESLQRAARVLGIGSDVDAWKRVPWAALGAREMTLLQAALLERFSPVTVRLTMSMVRGVLHQAFRLGLMAGEAYYRAKDTGKIKGERIPKGRMLTPEEIAKLRAHLATLPAPFGAQADAIFSLGLGGGLRRDELAGLDADALSVDDRNLRVMGKGRRERMQPLPSWVGASLRRWVDARRELGAKSASMFLALGRKGRVTDGPLSVWAVWSLITSIGRDAGIAAFTPHDLRRTFASALLSASDLATVQGLMRHKSSETTVLYDKRGDKQAEIALRALDAWGELGRAVPASGPLSAPAPSPEETAIDAAFMAERLGDAFYRDPASGKPLARRRKR